MKRFQWLALVEAGVGIALILGGAAMLYIAAYLVVRHELPRIW